MVDCRLLNTDQIGFHEITSDGKPVLHCCRSFRGNLLGDLDSGDDWDRRSDGDKDWRGGYGHECWARGVGYSDDGWRLVNLIMAICREFICLVG